MPKLIANKDYSFEPSDSENYYNIRILSGKYSSVVFRYDTLTLKKRWLRKPDVTFTYKIIEDPYQEVKDEADFVKVMREILEVEFFSLSG